MRHKTVFHWSGGKDSSIALFQMLRQDTYSIERLLTTVDKNSSRIAVHGVRQELLQQQVQRIGIPLTILEMPSKPDMETYNRLMQKQMLAFREEGFTHTAFGDIFLEDLKLYRQNEMKKAGFESIFPLWKGDTQQLASQFLKDGFKAITVCVDSAVLDRKFTGRKLNQLFFDDLPAGTDPCGENGEFHTFVYNGPIFSKEVLYIKGEVSHKVTTGPDSAEMGFWYCDLLPGS